MSNKIIEDNRRGGGGRSFFLALVRIIGIVVLWNLLLNAEFFQNAGVLLRVVYLIVFFIILEIVLQISVKTFRK